MEYPDLIRFLWSITETFLNSTDRLLFFFSERINVLGTTFTRFDLIFGAGLIVCLGYTIAKWFVPV